MYYFDNSGWLTTEIIPERSTTISPPEGSIPEGHNWNFTGYQWVLQSTTPEPVVPSISTVDLRLTKRAFQSRFPKSADTISTKYDLLTLFLVDDGYAATLSVGAALYPLRALIITGKNRLDASACVDLNTPDAAGFCALLQNPSIPSVFRLTQSEAGFILSKVISESERYRA